MQSFRSFLNEAANRSLSRIVRHSNSDRNIGVISAHTGDDEHQNRRNHKQLGRDLRKHGYGYVPVKGVYQGGHEKSYMVVGKRGDDGGHLHRTLSDLGKKYNQQSILYKHHKSNAAHLKGTKDGWTDPTGKERKAGETYHIGPLHSNVKSDYMTYLKGKRSFSFGAASQRKTNAPQPQEKRRLP